MRYLITVFMLLFANYSVAAVEAYSTDGGKTHNIGVAGTLLEGDAAKLEHLINTVPNFTGWVAFNSSGGLVAEGWSMSAIIRDHKIKTFISNNSVCMSACVYAFMGGEERFIQKGTIKPIGIHPSYVTEWTGEDTKDTAFLNGQLAGMGTAYGFMRMVSEEHRWVIMDYMFEWYSKSSRDVFYFPTGAELALSGIMTHQY